MQVVVDGPCPACGKVLDADSPIGHQSTPDPGDVSICVGCHVVLQYVRDADTGALHRAVMPAEEIERMPPEQRSTLETVLNALAHGKPPVNV